MISSATDVTCSVVKKGSSEAKVVVTASDKVVFILRMNARLPDETSFPIQSAAGQLVAYAWRTTGDDGQRYCFPPAEKFNRGLELWNFNRALEEKR